VKIITQSGPWQPTRGYGWPGVAYNCPIGMRERKLMRGILIILTLVLVALVAPIKSNAQSDSMIVLTCTLENGNPAIGMNITLDLARKTVLVETTNPYFRSTSQGSVTQITSQNVVFYVPGGNSGNSVTYSLDRYTGHATGVNQIGRGEYNCQKQQKQF
jgi:hypothetical protein